MARRADTDSAETDAKIRRSAIELFAQKGFAAVGIRDIARQAGLTTAALYHYMGNKEDLLVAIMTDVIEPLTESLRYVLKTHNKPEEQLVAFVELHVAVHGTRSAETLIADTEMRALSGDKRDAIVALRDEYEALWGSVVHAGTEAGVFDVVDEAVVTTALIEMCTSVAHWYKPQGRLRLEELCRTHADLALAMVRAHRGRRVIRRHDMDSSVQTSVKANR
jgi:AcrR family transcriptional regulator